jgi:hypothetical protein
MTFLGYLLSKLLDLLTTDAPPALWRVVYRNYAVGPFDYLEAM